MRIPRVELIQRSLRAHALSWAALIPVFGILLLVPATIDTQICLRMQRTEWNPARGLVRVAIALQLLAVLQTLFLVGAIIARILAGL